MEWSGFGARVNVAEFVTDASTDVDANEDSFIPDDYNLYQCYPNPFNARTTIVFDLPRFEQVEIEIYNILGQKVKSFNKSGMEPGRHRWIWDGTDFNNQEVSSGVYFYLLQTTNFSAFKKMLLLK